MVRPTGVTVIAVLCFLGTALCALFGLLTIVGGGFVATLINQQGAQGSAGVAGIMAGLGAALGAFTGKSAASAGPTKSNVAPTELSTFLMHPSIPGMEQKRPTRRPRVIAA